MKLLQLQSANMIERAIAQEDKSVILERLALQPEILTRVVEQLVQKKRGREEETAVLDHAAKRFCAPVTARNTKKGRLETRDFVIVGMCDGIMEDGLGVIEVKKRKNWFLYKYEYQLRLYNIENGTLLAAWQM